MSPFVTFLDKKRFFVEWTYKMLRQISHIALALFLLFSTAGLTFSMHYCGGNLVSTSINKEAKSCCDGSGGCCENKTLHFEINDDFVNTIQYETAKVVEQDVQFPILFAFNAELFPAEVKSPMVFSDSPSPPTIKKRLSLLQSFLC